ncbi:hypothetical protein H6501_03760 [Candidatus Woesearchaeota archaeon]|nr:hypothetical protein [Nanoarchaeota archaeon]MCB9370687.1 hypothetical protein [Candidatus Woesearchaeota archaeon]USN43771.1 MAG: hypothetical protein H6500_05260 [Candidatus Woesearchaeota archaeon]
MIVKSQKGQVIYEEYYVNADPIQRVYRRYIEQTLWDRTLNMLVFFALIFSLMSVIMEFVTQINWEIFAFIHGFSFLILLVFFLELFRTYAKSTTRRAFFKKHWPEVFLMSLLSFYFIVMGIFGITKFLGSVFLEWAMPYIEKSKVLLRFFRD